MSTQIQIHVFAQIHTYIHKVAQRRKTRNSFDSINSFRAVHLWLRCCVNPDLLRHQLSDTSANPFKDAVASLPPVKCE